MSDNLYDKISGFLKWNHDLFGEQVYVDRSLIEPQATEEKPMSQSAPAQLDKIPANGTPLREFYDKIHTCTKCSTGPTASISNQKHNPFAWAQHV